MGSFYAIRYVEHVWTNTLELQFRHLPNHLAHASENDSASDHLYLKVRSRSNIVKGLFDDRVSYWIAFLVMLI